MDAADIARLLATETRSVIERWCDSKARAVPVVVTLEGTTLLCRVLGERMMYVDGRDVSVAPHLAMSGYWEMWITQFLAREVKPGWRCIDVGANFGYYTLLFSILTGQKGEIEAWEPSQVPAEMLEKTLLINGISNQARVVHMAASDRSSRELLRIPVHQWGGASLNRQVVSNAANFRTQEVEMSTLDSRSALGQRPVDLLKIDAEGHEPEIWEGAQRILSNPNIHVLMEFTPKAYADPAGFLARIEGEGFRIYRVGDDGKAKPAPAPSLLGVPEFEMLWLKRG